MLCFQIVDCKKSVKANYWGNPTNVGSWERVDCKATKNGWKRSFSALDAALDWSRVSKLSLGNLYACKWVFWNF